MRKRQKAYCQSSQRIINIDEHSPKPPKDKPYQSHKSQNDRKTDNIFKKGKNIILFLILINLISEEIPHIRPSELTEEDLRTNFIHKVLHESILEIRPHRQVNIERYHEKKKFYHTTNNEDSLRENQLENIEQEVYYNK